MTRTPITRSGGFSLVELMVSIVIGLLAVLFATRIMTDGERNKDAALGGSDSMQNGMLAMFQISGDAEQAGYGLNDPLLVGCNTRFEDRQGYVLAPARRGSTDITPLAAAVIQPGGTGPDTLTLYAGSAAGGTPALRLAANYLNVGDVTVDRRTYGFALGDVIVMAPDTPGADCSLAQVSTDPETQDPPPAEQKIRFNGTSHRFNRGTLGLNYEANTARLFNLGPGARLAFHTWSVDKGFLMLRATDMANAAAQAQPVANDIVTLKAQYGFAAAGGFDAEAGNRIGSWSSTMVDADGDGTVGSAGDFGRIVALRLAVVARSRNPERPGADGECSATASAPTLFASAQPSGVSASPVEVDLAVAGDPVGWKCYRYRVFESIVTLRNAGWRRG